MWLDISTLTPLSPAERQVVEIHLPLLRGCLRHAAYRPFVRVLGWADSYQIGSFAWMRAAKTWHPPTPFSVYACFWLKRCLFRAAGELVAYPQPAEGLERLVSPAAGPERLAEVRDLVAAALGVLTGRQRDALKLRAQGYTGREIAGELGLSRSLVTRLQSQAQARIWRLTTVRRPNGRS